MYHYLRWMGCVVWFTAILILVTLIMKTSKAYKNEETKGCKATLITSIILDLCVGSAVGVLFYQVAELVKK